ncbi:MAG: GNAT family N-acetyltransferase [Alphaproteobacteria bacterium]|nr:GNAT family N-acetyltransferase [Alphaproteobacteria bacterium]
MTLRIAVYSGPALTPMLPALSRLRMAVFRAWPYLYEGDLAAEADYLADFVRAPTAGLVVAFDGQEPVGCSTCVALVEEDAGLTGPFLVRGIDPARVFYFGESVLLPAYRGRGAGVAFFAAREAHARAVSDCDFAAFCAVVRPEDHPARPAGHVPLDTFWRRRGFTPYPDLTCGMAWREVGGDSEIDHTLSFWIKSLHGKPLP